jgi:predicted enzyme related to lactoylglutathione lyase
MKRVTGLGGVFFKAENPTKLKEWYSKHLGVNQIFKWKDIDEPDATTPAQTVWSPFPADTKYFHPSEKPFMLNYRVKNLVELLQLLKDEGVEIVGELQQFDYGKFAWVRDPEGNKVELWEPVDD